jgi:site-specific DNA-methyltransferase (adenine-specific)
MVIMITDLEINRIICGDCLEVMKQFPDNCIDAVPTDSPYGLGMMSKKWDQTIPGIKYWTEILRVAKPGSHMLVFGGTRTHHRLIVAIEDAGWEFRDCLMWLYGSGMPKSKTSLKPAWEPIILARKPLEGTITENISKWGVGTLNIEQCRIDYKSEKDKLLATPQGKCTSKVGALAGGIQNNNSRTEFERPVQKGRHPANLLLDEQTTLLLDEQTGILTSGSGPCIRRKAGMFLEHGGNGKPGDVQHIYGDSGGASRFFYSSKVSQSEKNLGLPEGIKNTHISVKPISLMRYLCRLITPPNGLVLDPFCGSGSTLIAAKLEGFNYIGIDMEQEYVDTAKLRMAYYGR